MNYLSLDFNEIHELGGIAKALVKRNITTVHRLVLEIIGILIPDVFLEIYEYLYNQFFYAGQRCKEILYEGKDLSYIVYDLARELIAYNYQRPVELEYAPNLGNKKWILFCQTWFKDFKKEYIHDFDTKSCNTKNQNFLINQNEKSFLTLKKILEDELFFKGRVEHLILYTSEKPFFDIVLEQDILLIKLNDNIYEKQKKLKGATCEIIDEPSNYIQIRIEKLKILVSYKKWYQVFEFNLNELFFVPKFIHIWESSYESQQDAFNSYASDWELTLVTRKENKKIKEIRTQQINKLKEHLDESQQ